MTSILQSILHQIASRVADRLEERRNRISLAELRARVRDCNLPKDFRAAVVKGTGPNIIAEIKRRSPSLGDIAPQLEPLTVAREYLENGAAALSVLTEQDYFGGRLSDLAEIRAAFPAAHLLMKDFVIDEYQLLEARLHGADAVLLIAALLGESRTRNLAAAARELGLSILFEVHNEEEMRAVAGDADMIGVNNRDLHTLNISLETSKRLVTLAPPGACLVAESGIETGSDIRELMKHGYRVFLIGSSLMKTQTPGAAIARLIRESTRREST